jgi:hypothetical protein
VVAGQPRHLDLGALGVAARWADLAVATWSADWNYGQGWGTEVLSAYGVGDDPVRTRYYRLLWDLVMIGRPIVKQHLWTGPGRRLDWATFSS